MPISLSVAGLGDPQTRSRRTKGLVAPKLTASALACGFDGKTDTPTIPTVASSGDLPKILFIEQLSTLIGKTATTIRTCATNAKYAHLIPRPFKLPNSRRLCWYEHDVLAWINSTRPAEPPPKKRPRGRPTKVEQLARQRWAETATAQSNA
ncbi:hypothetical protein ABVD19_18645 [Xanthomonas euvesicatoria]|uniref:helix-turn-helix transcriptional regulator n=1 Tax=Xanthomonas TaxID=338 RepID=UPI000ABD48F1|nr:MULTISPECIES: hypothetical protein [Xanthomonas]